MPILLIEAGEHQYTQGQEGIRGQATFLTSSAGLSLVMAEASGAKPVETGCGFQERDPPYHG